jgi:hypothetical protein
LVTSKFASELPFHGWKSLESQWARSELNSVFGLENVDRWNPIRTSIIQSRSRPMRFLGFSNYETGAPRQEISKWSTVCSTSSRSGWSVVRSASIAKSGTSKNRPSPHLHKVQTRGNKVSPRTLQMALVLSGWSNRERWDGRWHVARMGIWQMHTKFWSEKPDWKRPLGIARRRLGDDISMDLGEIGRTMWTGFIWLRTGTSSGLLWTGTEPSGYIKGGGFLDWLSDCQLIKKDSAPWS